MRGEDRRSEGFFSYVRLEARIAADHPLRAICDLVDEALRKLSAAFTRLYAREGRPLIPPEREKRANATCSSQSCNYPHARPLLFTDLCELPPQLRSKPHSGGEVRLKNATCCGIVTAQTACWRFGCAVVVEYDENQLRRLPVPV